MELVLLVFILLMLGIAALVCVAVLSILHSVFVGRGKRRGETDSRRVSGRGH